ncbi:MAG: O-methyltransferase [Acidobacteriota bacterium]|nr:O-methyltransferase [Acidobacteriota bacterium]
MERIDEQLAARVDEYIERLFAAPDAALSENLREMRAAGIPEINVSPVQGKLLYLLARLAGARRVLEIGTLAGYSTTWLARALPPDGRLLTLEIDEGRAGVARRNLERAGCGEMVEIRVGPAADSLRGLIAAGTPPFDLIFVDADKAGYPEYLGLALQLARPGSVILADNVIRGGRAIEDAPPDDNARGAKAYNEAVAADPRLESVILPIFRGKLDGMAISIVR